MSQTPLGNAGAVPPLRRAAPLVGTVVAVLVVILASGGYLAAGAVTAGIDRQAAEVVVGAVVSDNNQFAQAMAKVSSPAGFTSVSQDPAQANAAMDGITSDLRQAHGTVTADLARLRRAGTVLRDQSGGILVVTQRGSLDQERARVDAVTTAFSAQRDALQVASDQIVVFSAMLDAAIALDGVTPILNRQDNQGALAAMPPVDAKMQRAVTLSKGSNVAPQMQALIGSMATFVTDLEQFLHAAQAGDVGALEALATRLQRDGDATANFDQAGFDAYESSLYKPYEDRADAALRRAGFKVVTSPT